MGNARLSVGSGVPREKPVIEVGARGSRRLGARFSWHFEARMVAQAGTAEKLCAKNGPHPCYSETTGAAKVTHRDETARKWRNWQTRRT
jgi:hypothetical protein